MRNLVEYPIDAEECLAHVRDARLDARYSHNIGGTGGICLNYVHNYLNGPGRAGFEKFLEESRL